MTTELAAGSRTRRKDGDGVVDVRAAVTGGHGPERLDGQRRGIDQVAGPGHGTRDKMRAVRQPPGPGDVDTEREPGCRGDPDRKNLPTAERICELTGQASRDERKKVPLKHRKAAVARDVVNIGEEIPTLRPHSRACACIAPLRHACGFPLLRKTSLGQRIAVGQCGRPCARRPSLCPGRSGT